MPSRVLTLFVLLCCCLLDARSQSTSAPPIEIARWPDYRRGWPQTVALAGEHVYSGTTAGLHALDFTDPSNPRRVWGYSPTDTHAQISSLLVTGNRLYSFGPGVGLRSYDITQPAVPVTSGAVSIPFTDARMALMGNRILLADRGTWEEFGRLFSMVRVIDPVRSVVETTLVLTNHSGTQSLAVKDGYAFLVPPVGDLRIVDLRDPARPRSIGNFATPTNAQITGIAALEQFIYLGTATNGLIVLDVSNPAAPVERGRFLAPASITGLAVSGEHLFVGAVAALNGSLRVLSITNRAQPVEIARVEMDAPRELAVAGTRLAGITGDGVITIDVTDPRHPALHGRYQEGAAQGIALTGNLAYLADGPAGLQVLDVSEPRQPRSLTRLADAAPANDIGLLGTRAVLAMGPIIRVLDISTPAQPMKLVDIPAHLANAVAIAAPYAFITDHFDGLVVLDLSDPNRPQRVAGLPLREGASRIAVANGFAGVAAGENGWFILDVADPANPRTLAHHPGLVTGIALRGRTFFVTDHTTGLQIFDTTFPSAPQRLGGVEVKNSRYPSAIDVIGDRAFLGLVNHGIDVYDLTALPQLKWIATLPKSPPLFGAPLWMHEVAVAGKVTFVTDPTQGLVIYEEPPAPILRTILNAQHVQAGEAVTWTVDATGTAPIRYQWHKDGKPILGATTNRLLIASAASQDAGAYSVVVEDAFGTATSGTATLTVDPRRYDIQLVTTAVSEGGRWRVDFRISPSVLESFTLALGLGDGTARPGDDFHLDPGSVLLVPGATQASFEVETVSDSFAEGDETIVLTLRATDPSRAILSPDARLTLTLRDTAGRIEFGDIPDLRENVGTVEIPVRRQLPASGRAAVDYTVEASSNPAAIPATPGKDFTSVAGTLTFELGETLKSFRLPITDDTERELTERLTLRLENPRGAELAGGSSHSIDVDLIDDDGLFELVTLTNRVAEGVGSARFTVRRLGPVDTTRQVDYRTEAFSARGGIDFVAQAGTLTFEPGVTVRTIDIPIVDDGISEDVEALTVQLLPRPGDWQVTGSRFGFVFIYDDDEVKGSQTLGFSPGLAGQWPGYERGPAANVAVRGPYAYVGGQGLQIFDITEITQPRRVGEFSTPSFVAAIAIVDSYAYLTDYNTGLHVVDLSDPVRPRSAGKAPAQGPGQQYAVNGDLFVTNSLAFIPGQSDSGGARLWIFDVSQPTAPRRVGVFSLDSGAFGSVAVSGQYAYVGSQPAGQPGTSEAVMVIDVSDPANPRRAGGFGSGGMECQVALAGGYLFATGLGEALTVLDVSNPATPRRVAGYKSPRDSFPHRLALADQRAYLSSLHSGFPNPLYSAVEAIDISDPLRPKLVSTTQRPDFNHPFEMTRLKSVPPYVYGAAGDEGLFIYDFTQVDKPTLATRIETAGSTTSVAIEDSIAVLADTTAGVRILDISNPDQPSELGRFDAATPVDSVVYTPPFAYTANSQNRWGTSLFRVLDLTSPRQPVPRGELNLDPSSWRLRLAQFDSRYVLAASTGYFFPLSNKWRGKLQVIDVQDPDRPSLAGTVEFEDEVRNVVVSGVYAYVLETVTQPNRGAFGARVNVIDLADPRSPRKIGEYFTANSNYGGDLAVAGGYLYLSVFLPDPRLVVLDVRDPANPSRLGIQPMNYHHALAVHGAALFAYESFIGIQQFDLGNPATPRAVGAYSFPPKRFPLFQQSYGGLAFAGGRIFVPNTSAGMLILDTQARVEFAAPQFAAFEEDGQARVRIRRTGNISVPVFVEWTAESGTATAGADFPSGARGKITIPAWAEEQSFVVPLLDDALDEPAETMRVRLVNPSAGASLGSAAASGVLLQDGPDRFEFTAATLTADESAGKVDIVVRRRPADRPGAAAVKIETVAGSALPDQDFTPVSLVLEFAPGETERSVALPIADDGTREPIKTFQVILKNPTANAVLGSQSEVKVRIQDNDTGFEFATQNYTVTEDQPSIILTVRRGNNLGRVLTVDFATQDGTATAEADYAPRRGTLVFAADESEKSIEIPIIEDTVFESPESFRVMLLNPGGDALLGTLSTVNVSIVEDDSLIHFAEPSWSISEAAAVTTFVVRREHAIDREVRVGYSTRDGTARAGSDFKSTTGTLIFGLGETTKVIQVPILDDSDVEPLEQFYLTLSTADGGVSLTHPSEAVMNIVDSEAPVSVFDFEFADYAVNELAGHVAITLTRSEPAIGHANIEVRTGSGTATAGADFHSINTTIGFSAGLTRQTITIPILEDTLVEADETFTLILANPSGEPGTTARLGERHTATVTIRNAGNAVAFSQQRFDGFESNAVVMVTVQRRGEIDRPFSVSYITRDGTATAGLDYVAQSGTLTFEPFQRTRTFVVPILDDFSAEGSEQFTVLLSDPTNGAVLHPSATTAAIVLADNERRVWIDPGFNARLSSDSSINAIALQPDGKILIGGWFRFEDQEIWLGLARLTAAGADDPSFRVGLEPGKLLGTVTALLVQPDGKLLVASNPGVGSPTPAVYRLESSGHIDPTFAVASIEGQSPNVIELQPDGKIILGGWFTSVAGSQRTSLARLQPDGSLDRSFDAGKGATYRSQNLNDTTGYLAPVSAIRVMPDAKIYVAGAFMHFNGTSRLGVARLNPNGSLDNTFDPGAGAVIPPSQWQPLPTPAVRTLAVQEDGKVILGGWFTHVAGQPGQGLARLNTDGTLDPTANFGAGQIAWQTVTALSLQPDGRLVIGGGFQSLDGPYSPNVIRLTAHGVVDPLVGQPSPIDAPSALAVEPTGNILVAGYFESVDGATRRKLIRLVGDTQQRRTLDFTMPTWTVTENATNLVLELRRGGDSGETMAVDLAAIDGTAKAGQQYEPRNQTLAFAPGEVSKQVVIPILDNGRLNPPSSFELHLSNPTPGTLVGPIDQARVDILDNEVSAVFDPGYTPDVNGSVGRGFPLPDGEYLISGADSWTAFGRVDGIDTGPAARLLRNGALDRSFIPRTVFTLEEGNCCYSIHAVIPHADGKTYYGGYFQLVHGVRRPGLARLNADDSLDTTFVPAESIGFGGYALALQADGKLLVATDSGLWRLLPDGSVDPSFQQSQATCCITSIVPLANGQIVVAGQFTEFNGQPRYRVARLHADGTLDESFVPIDGDPVTGYSFERVLAIQPDGRPILTGYAESEARRRDSFVRLGLDGLMDASFLGSTVVNRFNLTQITSALVQPDGGLIIAAYADHLPTGGYGGLVVSLDSKGAVPQGTEPVVLPGLYLGKGDGLRVLPSPTPGNPDKVMISAEFLQVPGGPPSMSDRIPSRLVQIDLRAQAEDSKFGIERGEGLAIEGSTVTFWVVRVGDVSRTESVRYRIEADAGQAGFIPLEGTLSFDPMTIRKPIHVPLPDNASLDAERRFELTLSDPNGGASIARETASLAILDDEQVGAIDLAFNAGLESPPGYDRPSVFGITVLPDGRLLIDGTFVTVHGTWSESWAVLNPNGSLAVDGSNLPLPGPSLRFRQPDGSSLGFVGDRFVRHTAEGSPDQAFNVAIEPLHSVTAAVNLPDGRVVISGNFERIAGIPWRGLARFHPDGTLDTTFDLAPRFQHPSADNRYFGGLLAQPDGKTLVSGNFVAFDNIPRNGLLRLNADGSLDPGFDPQPRMPSSVANYVRSMLLQEDGKILVLGRLSLVEPRGRAEVLRLNRDGTVDSSFTPLGQGAVAPDLEGFDVMAFGPDSTLYVGGRFSRFGPIHRAGLVRLRLASSAPPVITRAGFNTAGAFAIQLSAVAGRSYELHASSDLLTWTRVVTAVATGETLELADPTPRTGDARFYRVVQAPANP